MLRSILPLSAIAAAALTSSGCSGPAEAALDPAGSAAPVVKSDTTAKAVLGGRVLDEAGLPIQGATLTALATGDKAVTEANGDYLLAAEAEASLIIEVTAEGYAPALLESVLLDGGTTSLGHDVRLYTAGSLETISSEEGDPPELDTYGVIAVTIVSLTAGCSATGATVTYLPAPAAKIAYPPFGGHAGAVGVSEGIAAYVLRALPPGAYDRLELDGASCDVAAFPVSYLGRTYEGALKVDAGKLTQATLFLQ